MNWTIRKILEWSTTHLREKNLSSSPRLDVEILLGRALGCTRVNLYCDMERPLSVSEREDFKKLFVRRCNSEPIAYILNNKEFYGFNFYVDAKVLIPRPETELIVDYASHIFSKDEPLNILDIGTGSGCLAITLSKVFPNAMVTAIDVSKDALEVAQKNAKHNECEDRIIFKNMDAKDQNSWKEIDKRFDLIVANLPYVPNKDLSDLAPDVKNFEPHLALFGGERGTEIMDQVFEHALQYLNDSKNLNSYFICEVGQHQANILEESLRKINHITFVEVIKDLAHIDRHLVFKSI